MESYRQFFLDAGYPDVEFSLADGRIPWMPMMIIRFKAFSKGLTPYPRKAKWFCVPIGAVPALVPVMILGPNTALGAGIGTMFLRLGNAFMFGGLLATLPSAEQFETFEDSLRRSAEK